MRFRLRYRRDLLAPYPVRPGGDPWEELANAVVYQAAADWRRAARTLRHPPGRPGEVQNRQLLEAARMLCDCEKFFRSEWICVLTEADGAAILERLKKELKKPMPENAMNAREYLGQAARLDEEIDSRVEELSRLHALSLSAPPGPEGTPTVKKLLSLAGQVSREIDELVDLKDEIRRAIDSVPDPEEREVLRCRYLLGMNYYEIAGKLHMGIATVKRRHSRGLSRIRPPA